ncbi:MAG: hypothetical protein ACK47B_01715 [Armatimonadota bacterium]
MKRRLHGRRGGTLALVLALYLALGAVLLGAVSLAAASAGAAERDYRRSQALALAEAGLAEAIAGAEPHQSRPLGLGRYAWSVQPQDPGRLVTARGEVESVSGAVVTRTVRALLARSGPGWKIVSWEEGSR